MKQILSVADLATMLNLVNKEIISMEMDYDCPLRVREFHSKKEYEQAKQEQREELKSNPFYKSIVHLKQALENLNVEIETPELKVEGENK